MRVKTRERLFSLRILRNSMFSLKSPGRSSGVRARPRVRRKTLGASAACFVKQEPVWPPQKQVRLAASRPVALPTGTQFNDQFRLMESEEPWTPLL